VLETLAEAVRTRRRKARGRRA